MPSLHLRVRDRALPAHWVLPKAVQTNFAHVRKLFRGRGGGVPEKGETHQHLHADHTVDAPLHDSKSRQRLAVLDAAGHKRVLAVLPERRLPQAVGEGRGKGRVGLHAVDVFYARRVESVELRARPGPEVHDHTVSLGDERGDRSRGLEGNEVVAWERGLRLLVMIWAFLPGEGGWCSVV